MTSNLHHLSGGGRGGAQCKLSDLLLTQVFRRMAFIAKQFIIFFHSHLIKFMLIVYCFAANDDTTKTFPPLASHSCSEMI